MRRRGSGYIGGVFGAFEKTIGGAVGNEEIFRRFYEGAWSRGDVAAVDRFLDENFVNHEIPDVSGSHREAYRRAIEETYAAFPDWKTQIEDLISANDRVAARWHSSGTHTGKLSDLRPTGARVQTRGITIVHVANGRITDFWKTDNAHTVPQQLLATSEPSN